MSLWDDYHLNDPAFCTPLPVMRGLVSALCERREAVDSEFHASCTSSGVSAVVENRLAHILGGEWYDDADLREIPFRKIRKEYAYDEIWGCERNLSFMHVFDAFLIHTLEAHSEVMGYGTRQFTDSAGSTVYGSPEDLASALSERLIAPDTVPAGSSSGAVDADGTLQVCLNAAWAAQRMRMLKLLRRVRVVSGGFTMRYAAAPGDLHSYGASPQDAYDAIPSWSLADTGFAGWETPMGCRVEYRYTGFDAPDERWTIHSAREIAQIVPDHRGCLAASAGFLRFGAVDLRERDETGTPQEDGINTYVFDPLCTSVSSGANTLPLSSGVFASWGYGTASAVGGSGTAPGDYIRGWQAQNVEVVYDYESNFNFKQGE